MPSIGSTTQTCSGVPANEAADSSPRKASSGNAALELAGDEVLDRAIGATDEVLRALVLDDQRVALGEQVARELAGPERDRCAAA